MLSFESGGWMWRGRADTNVCIKHFAGRWPENLNDLLQILSVLVQWDLIPTGQRRPNHVFYMAPRSSFASRCWPENSSRSYTVPRLGCTWHSFHDREFWSSSLFLNLALRYPTLARCPPNYVLQRACCFGFSSSSEASFAPKNTSGSDNAQR